MNAKPRNAHPVRTVLLLVSGVTLGFFLVRDFVMAEQKSPLQQIEHGFFYVDLDEDSVFEPRPKLALSGEDLARDHRVFQWAQGQYSGDLEESPVQTLIAAGRADSLEGRLSGDARKDLLTYMASSDRELKEMIFLVEEENAATKKKLRTTPDRHILMRTRPYDKDVNWEALKKATQLTNGGKGVVWGELHPEGSIQLVLFWKEWPGLKKLHDQQTAMIHNRRRLVRKWIDKEFKNRGMTLFGS